MDFESFFSFEDAELFGSGGSRISAVQVIPAPFPEAEPFPKSKGALTDPIPLPIETKGKGTHEGPDSPHDGFPLMNTVVHSSKLTQASDPLEDASSPQCRNETGISLMDDEPALEALLDELIENYAESSFQAQLHKLVSDECKRQHKPYGTRLVSVIGRANLARTVQNSILPKYGFLGTTKGLAALKTALKPYMNEKRILNKMLTADELLCMPPGTTSSDCKFNAALMKPNIIHP